MKNYNSWLWTTIRKSNFQKPRTSGVGRQCYSYHSQTWLLYCWPTWTGITGSQQLAAYSILVPVKDKKKIKTGLLALPPLTVVIHWDTRLGPLVAWLKLIQVSHCGRRPSQRMPHPQKLQKWYAESHNFSWKFRIVDWFNRKELKYSDMTCIW
jgi:hypothetical protein